MLSITNNKQKTKNMTTTNKKATMATIKSFVKKNRENLLINVKSSFDGMIDGLSYINNGFQKATTDNTNSQ